MNKYREDEKLFDNLDTMPFIGYDARLYRCTFIIKKKDLNNMQHTFNDIVYHFQSHDHLQVGDKVQVIGHQNNILIVKKIN